MTGRVRCPVCTRPEATEHDYATLPEGEGDGLCWRAWDERQCETVAPGRAELQRRISAALAVLGTDGATNYERVQAAGLILTGVACAIR